LKKKTRPPKRPWRLNMFVTDSDDVDEYMRKIVNIRNQKANLRTKKGKWPASHL